MTTREERSPLAAAEEITVAIKRGGGSIALTGEDIEVALPDDLAHLLPALKEHKAEIVGVLRREVVRPASMSYGEYFCRERDAGRVAISREEWEAEHGSDAERMTRYEHLCRWGSSRQKVQ